ncbi:type IV pilus assembly protein PilM [Patescibacteria group bacterium]|nr:type IV pilus assembly protein PilM [Patescibacteria group bacterium]
MSLFSKHAFGLDISDRSIEAFEVKKKFGKNTVVATSRIVLDEGMVANGRILNKEQLVSAVQQLMKKATPRRIKTNNVVLSIPESKVFLYVFELPAAISPKNIGESVQYKAEETIPLAFNQVYHDYQVINQAREFQDVLYAACAKDIVDDLRDVIKQAGLSPVVIEPESTSIARAIVGDDTDLRTLIVDAGARNTVITIYDRHGIRYAHTLDIGGNILNEIIIKQLSISHEEAEKKKYNTGLKTNGDSGFSLEQPIAEMAHEIGRALRYYERKTKFSVGKIIMCGGTSLLPGLSDYIYQQVKIPVEAAKPLARIQYSSKLKLVEKRIPFYSTVTGLALRGASEDIDHSGLNLLRRADDHHKAVTSLWPIKPKTKKTGQVKKVKVIEETYATKDKKKLFKLLGVFIFLILVFFAVLIFRPTGDDNVYESVPNQLNTE